MDSQKILDVFEVPKNDESTKCHLLALPGELRNKIYELVIPSGEIIDARSSSWTTTDRTTTRIILIREPPMLQSCRQIRAKALAFFYGSNIVRCNSGSADSRPTALITHASEIKQLQVVWGGGMHIGLDFTAGISWPKIEYRNGYPSSVQSLLPLNWDYLVPEEKQLYQEIESACREAVLRDGSSLSSALLTQILEMIGVAIL